MPAPSGAMPMAEMSFEQRRHKRHELACPVSLPADDPGASPRPKTVNISNGGVLLPVSGEAAPPVGSRLRVRFAVPRATPNTFLFEDFAAEAVVVRAETDGEENPVRVALRFETPIHLGIEV